MTRKRDADGAGPYACSSGPDDEHPSIIETSQFRALVELDAELFSEPPTSPAGVARGELFPDDLVPTDKFETLPDDTDSHEAGY